MTPLPLRPHAQIHGTCLGFQLLHILASNISRNVLLVETDSTSHASTLEFTPAAKKSRSFGTMDVSGACVRSGEEGFVGRVQGSGRCRARGRQEALGVHVG